MNMSSNSKVSKVRRKAISFFDNIGIKKLIYKNNKHKADI